MNVVALIPLRSGSKSIPHKNIRPLAGKPLFWWTAAACVDSGIFAKVVVSTDSREYGDLVRAHFPQIEILARPAELAADTTSTEAVMLHAADHYAFDVLCTVQATSPLLAAEDLRRGWAQLVREGCDSMVSAVRTKRFFWGTDARPLNYDPAKRPRRQDHDGIFMENGAFYFTRRELLLASRSRLGGKIGIAEMPEDTAVELDEPLDWVIVEDLLRRRAADASQAAKVKLLVVDVDGTLTDAGMYYSAEGDQLKKFNTRDAKGLELVRGIGVAVAIVTTEASPIVTARARKLQIEDCFIGAQDKLAIVRQLAAKHGIGLNEIAYVGDDINDLECLRSVGFPCCPADAVDQVKSACSYIAARNGGAGAVREIAELIISQRKGG